MRIDPEFGKAILSFTILTIIFDKFRTAPFELFCMKTDAYIVEFF